MLWKDLQLKGLQENIARKSAKKQLNYVYVCGRSQSALGLREKCILNPLILRVGLCREVEHLYTYRDDDRMMFWKVFVIKKELTMKEFLSASNQEASNSSKISDHWSIV